MGRQTDRQTDSQIERQAYRNTETDRQTDKETICALLCLVDTLHEVKGLLKYIATLDGNDWYSILGLRPPTTPTHPDPP